MDRNTVVFHVDLTCERNPNAPKGSTKDHELYINHELLSSHLVWVPAGEQDEVFAGKPPAPINPNIVMAKLRPGQRVNMELHAVKGVGKDHAKFCPVGKLDLVSQLFKIITDFLYSNGFVSSTTSYQDHKTNTIPPHPKVPEMFLSWSNQN
jgi:DNA-directed RNA polymerase alpha subunit